MTPDEAENLAMAHCEDSVQGKTDFALLVAEISAGDEREACAKICESLAPWGNSSDDFAAKLLRDAAKKIRDRTAIGGKSAQIQI